MLLHCACITCARGLDLTHVSSLPVTTTASFTKKKEVSLLLALPILACHLTTSWIENIKRFAASSEHSLDVRQAVYCPMKGISMADRFLGVVNDLISLPPHRWVSKKLILLALGQLGGGDTSSHILTCKLTLTAF